MIKQCCLILCCTFIIYLLWIYINQRNLIYAPDRHRPNRQIAHADDMQEILLKTSDNLKLLAWYKPSVPPKPTIVLFHGNAGNISHRMPLVRQLLNQRYGVLLPEYRGYGGNKGQPTEAGLYRDAAASMAFLKQHHVEKKNIILYGESLGTAIATELATQNRFCALILQSPFTSLRAMAKIHYPWILFKPIDQFDTLSRIQNIHTSLLILHGKEDSLVPYSEGQKLFNSALEPKKWIGLQGKAHNDLWDKEFYAKVLHFIQKQKCVL